MRMPKKALIYWLSKGCQFLVFCYSAYKFVWVTLKSKTLSIKNLLKCATGCALLFNKYWGFIVALSNALASGLDVQKFFPRYLSSHSDSSVNSCSKDVDDYTIKGSSSCELSNCGHSAIVDVVEFKWTGEFVKSLLWWFTSSFFQNWSNFLTSGAKKKYSTEVFFFLNKLIRHTSLDASSTN